MHLTGSSERPTDVVISYVALQHVPHVERVEIGNRGLLEIEAPVTGSCTCKEPTQQIE